MRHTRALVTFAVFAVMLLAPPHAVAITLPAGFTDELVTTLPAPTAVAFTPDGRLLATTQAGQLRVVDGGALLPTAALDLSARICANSERGLLGVAVDPQFASNRHVYLYWTWKKHGVCETNTAAAPVNRVSRFVLGDDDLVDPLSEVTLVDNMPSPAGNHNAGDLAFGKDGNLYVTVGDGGCDYAGGGCAGANDAARDQHVLTGKVLRVTKDGGIPAGNPFTGADSAVCAAAGRTDPGKRCRETYAWGLRNPFRFAFDPNAATTRFFVNDVGQGRWEEIDLGQAGADYGWNVREGLCANGSTTDCGPAPAGMTNPIYAYGRTDGCASITGGAFVPNGVWPTQYDGTYLFADYVCGTIFRLDPAGPGWTRTPFATGLGGSSAVHLEFGPMAGGGQALYYTTYASGGQVRRIRHTASNGVPTAAFTASPTSGPAPLEVDFDASTSSDPDGDALTYLWAFGDGASATTTTANTSHTYASSGTYTASLEVRDARGAVSSPAARQIAVDNSPPVATITSPGPGSTFAVGQTILLTGTGTDAQDGTLPTSARSWSVLLHHNGEHTHPLASGTGSQLSFQAPAPEDLAATDGSYVEARLTVTDSGGLTSTVSRVLQPRRVAITFATSPAGRAVLVNGFWLPGPTTITSWEGWRLDVATLRYQGRDAFWFWSDGGTRIHPIVTPASPATYTAVFRRLGRTLRGL